MYWDILVDWSVYPKLIIDLASDANCPRNKYFLHILYTLTGKVVRHKDKNIDLEKFFEIGRENGKYAIFTWINNSERLLQNPETFVYEDWFAGKMIDESFDSLA